MSSLKNDDSFDLSELQWTRVKDADFTQIVTVSLEDIFRGTERTVIIKREIRQIGKRVPEIEEARYTVTIEPGCVDRKTFHFIEAGHQDPVNIPGDLIVEIRTEQHPLYERSGSDLIYKAKVSWDDVCILLIV
jgi:DnaJ-class molecular chaperone